MTTEEPAAEGEGPAQTVKNLAAEREDAGSAGPNFPSGMNTTEALLSGATANLGDAAEAAIAAAKGEAPAGGGEEAPAEEPAS